MPASPRLLFQIDDVRASQLRDGTESSLTPAGPRPLAILAVPTTGRLVDVGSDVGGGSGADEIEDFYLHLHLPPVLELPLPATTPVFRQPPDSYLIPRWDVDPAAAESGDEGKGMFVRLTLPPPGSGRGHLPQDELDTFETILAQCTAFRERQVPPVPSAQPSSSERLRSQGPPPPLPPRWGEQRQAAEEPPTYSPYKPYNPADYVDGQADSKTDSKAEAAGPSRRDQHGQLVLVDEEDGSVVGELADGFDVEERPEVQQGSKDPVEIQLPDASDKHAHVTVANAPAPAAGTAAAGGPGPSRLLTHSSHASRLLIMGADHLASSLTRGADALNRRIPPANRPLDFSPATQARVRRLHTLSASSATASANLSAAALGRVGKIAQSAGAGLARRQRGAAGGDVANDPRLASGGGGKRALLNRSLLAVSTIADGLDTSAQNLAAASTTAASSVVGHRYGDAAGRVAADAVSAARNVALVYIDRTGVSRRAVVKAAARGMVVGCVRDGQRVVVGDAGDGDKGGGEKGGEQRDKRAQ